jgi:hypothetical protein
MDNEYTPTIDAPRLERDSAGRLPLESLTARWERRVKSLRREYVQLMRLSRACSLIGQPLRRRRFTKAANRTADDYVIAAHRAAKLREALDDIGDDARLQYDYVQMLRSTTYDSSQERELRGTAGRNQYSARKQDEWERLERVREQGAHWYRQRKRRLAEAAAAGIKPPDIGSLPDDLEEAWLVVAEEILARRQERDALIEELDVDPQAARPRIKTLEDDLEDLAALSSEQRVSRAHWTPSGKAE